MADSWHVNWLSEGVEKWNRRRKKVGFSPDLSGVKFFDLLPEDYRDSPKTSRYFEGIDFSGSNLSGANLSGLNFQNAKFSNAILSNADMSKSNFIGANFKKADLSGADLEKSLFDRAVFEFANLRGVSFKGVGLEGALFIESDVSEEQIETAKDHSAQVFLTQKSYRDYLSTAIYQKNAEGLDVWPKVLADGGMAKSVDTKSDDRTVKHKYDVFFGTNRNPMFERVALTDFGRNIHSELSLGVCEVVIPEGHRMGSLGSPRWKRLINRYDDRIKLDQIIYLNEDFFWKLIRETSNRMKIKEKPTIFIHGFNNTFKDAVLRAAQIGYDLGLGQGIGLFSWPSQGSVLKYSADETVADASKYALADYLEEFVKESNQNSINIIAHSMGCRCLLSAIEILANGRKKIIKSINQIILAAADVDASIMPRLGVHAVSHVKRTTSYISDRDKALITSGWLHSFPRVGVTPPTFILKGMDTILVNDLDLGNFSHGYVGSSRTIISDMFDLLKSNTPPEERHAIESVSVGAQNFWKIRN